MVRGGGWGSGAVIKGQALWLREGIGLGMVGQGWSSVWWLGIRCHS